MAEYTLPHFGTLPIGNLESYYDVDTELNGNDIQIDLNFENESIDTSTMDKIKSFIENIEKFDKLNLSYIQNDFNDDDGETVKIYLDHHLEEVDHDELAELINFGDNAIELNQQLMTKLKLVRVGLYPENEDYFATFDYSIGKDITDYLVVINTDKDGQLVYMTMES